MVQRIKVWPPPEKPRGPQIQVEVQGDEIYVSGVPDDCSVAYVLRDANTRSRYFVVVDQGPKGIQSRREREQRGEPGPYIPSLYNEDHECHTRSIYKEKYNLHIGEQSEMQQVEIVHDVQKGSTGRNDEVDKEFTYRLENGKIRKLFVSHGREDGSSDNGLPHPGKIENPLILELIYCGNWPILKGSK